MTENLPLGRYIFMSRWEGVAVVSVGRGVLAWGRGGKNIIDVNPLSLL